MTSTSSFKNTVSSVPHTGNSRSIAYAIRGIALLLTMVSLVIAETDDDSSRTEFSKAGTQRYTHYLGGAAGYTSGLGLSYRHWFGNNWGFQITGFPWYREYTYPEDDNNSYGSESLISGEKTETMASFGVLFLKNLADVKYVRFLGYAGGNTFYQYDKSDYVKAERTYDYDLDRYINDTVHVDKTYKSKKVTLGLGAGAEWYLWRFGFHLLLGFAGSHDFESGSNAVMPTVEGGVHFRFNWPKRKKG